MRQKVYNSSTSSWEYVDSAPVTEDGVVQSDTTARLTAGSVEPSNPSEGDVWIDTNPSMLRLSDTAVGIGKTPEDGALDVAGDIYSNGRAVTSLGDEHYYTSSGTWTKPAGLKFVIVELQGGGGGGGSSGSSNSQVGGGGGGGGYAKKKIISSELGSTEVVTVGGGGGGGSLTSNRGGNGGTSSFGSHVSASGGQGGGHGNEGFVAGGGGTSGGDLGIPGQVGGGGGDIGDSGDSGGLRAVLRSGIGGDSFMGFGAYVSNNQGDGRSGNGYGSGGAGGLRNTSASRGGAGTGGIVIVHEYF